MEKFGEFDLIAPLAQGGMAELFNARHRQSGEQVVLKRLLPEVREEAELVELFLTEADVGALLKHRNIVPVIDSGEVDGVYYLVMEFVKGTDLKFLLWRAGDDGNLLPTGVAIRIGVDALRGLDAAHRLESAQGTPFGLVHRDVSPDNLFVNLEGITKVADFGIAKLANLDGLTNTGFLKGKLTYMSPEQVKSEPLDGRADGFSLALILYEALSGKRPFAPEAGESEIETFNRVRKGRVPKLRREAPTPVCRIINKALRRSRLLRFPNCGALADALETTAEQLGYLATHQEVASIVQRIHS